MHTCMYTHTHACSQTDRQTYRHIHKYTNTLNFLILVMCLDLPKKAFGNKKFVYVFMRYL